jgi:hypothetical protein
MERQTNYIVFLCHGNKGVFYECAYALLSLARLCTPKDLRNTEIWIYTDDADWFVPFKSNLLPVYYKKINEATIKEWRGAINFVHRAKVEMLKDFSKDKSGNILYVDTDVVFTHRVENILQGIDRGNLYMHSMEGIVRDCSTSVFKKLNSHFKRSKYKINGKPLVELAMWNAGVVGFNTKFKPLLDEVLAFTDKEYPKFPKHIMEQFAFSVYFQREGNVKAASPYIFHYWKLKEARLLLASFFDHFKGKSFEELAHYSVLIQMPALMQEKVDFYHNWNIPSAIMNKEWIPAKQDWEEMIKQI